MVALETPNIEFGWKAQDFSLLNVDGELLSLKECAGKNGLVVMFICNHCPYVQSILHKIVRDTAELVKFGVHSVAIMPNDFDSFPDDNYENMKLVAAASQFPFPYVIDETQSVAKSYGAVCTPDFFGFNKDLELMYRGRLDDSKKENKQSGKRELFDAMIEIANTGSFAGAQNPSVGCSIKWKDS